MKPRPYTPEPRSEGLKKVWTLVRSLRNGRDQLYVLRASASECTRDMLMQYGWGYDDAITT